MMTSDSDVPICSMRPRESFDPSIAFQHDFNGIADGTLADNCFAGSNSDSEWEYEYSTTESETFYMTLNLPVARSTSKVDEGPKGGRTTKRRDKWLNSTHAPFVDDKRSKQAIDRFDNEATKDVAEYNGISRKNAISGAKNASPVAVRQKGVTWTDGSKDTCSQFKERLSLPKENGMSGSQSAAQKSQGDKEATVKAPEIPTSMIQGTPLDIQILELHSKHPIVIYRNQQFECDWAENIGTELLFINHSDTRGESEAKLPIVRELPGGVDLLAVSGVRVLGRPINLTPKVKGSETQQKSNIQAKVQTHSARTQNLQIHSYFPLPNGISRIPVGAGANEDRKAQARFLERLSAIKSKRGEHDEVTVNAIPRKEGRARKVRAQEKRRESRILRDNHSSAQRKARARAKLAEWDALEKAGNIYDNRSTRAASFDFTNEKSLDGHGISGTSHTRDQNVDEEDADEEENQDEDDEDEVDENEADEDEADEDENDEESDSNTDNNTVTDPGGEEVYSLEDEEDEMNELGNEQPIAMGGDKDRMYILEEEDYDMDDEEEDDLSLDVENGIHLRSFNPGNTDINMDVDT